MPILDGWQAVGRLLFAELEITFGCRAVDAAAGLVCSPFIDNFCQIGRLFADNP